MNLIEFIGFVVSLVAMLFLFTKRLVGERKSRLEQSLVQKEEFERERAQQFLSSEEDIEEEFFSPFQEKRAPEFQGGAFESEQPNSKKMATLRDIKEKSILSGTRRVAASKPSSQDPKNPYFTHLKVAENYEVARKNTVTHGSTLIGSLKSKKDMLVIKEIFDKPLSMRNREW